MTTSTAPAPAPLRHSPPFRRLVGGWTLANLGDSALILVLPIWVRDRSGSATAGALLFAVYSLAALAAPVAGYLADTWSRRSLMAATDVAAAALLLALAGFGAGWPLGSVWAIAFAYAFTNTVASVARFGLVRDLVQQDQLVAANAVMVTIDQGLRIVAPFAGVALYTAWNGVTPVVLAAAGLLLAGAAVIATVPSSGRPVRAEAVGRWTAAFGAGVRRVASVRQLRDGVVAVACIFLAGGVLNAAVFAVVDAAGREPSFLAVIVTVQSVASVLAGPMSAPIIRRLGELHALAGGAALAAVGFGLLATGSAPIVLVGAVVNGLWIPIVVVAITTIAQRAASDDDVGGTGAVVDMAINAPATLGVLGGAFALRSVGMPATLTSCAVALVLVAVWIRRCALRPTGRGRGAGRVRRRP